MANRFVLHITIHNLMKLVITLRMFFTATHRVFLINLRDAGNSLKANSEKELSMIETIHDLEAIREALQLPTWHFAGHSTGGMLGLLYAITYPHSLQSLVVAGSCSK